MLNIFPKKKTQSSYNHTKSTALNKKQKISIIDIFKTRYKINKKSISETKISS